MADPTIKTFSALIEGQAAAVQARAAGLIDYTIGSILRAVGEATGGVALWLQGLILVLLRATRLSTSTDADADTFVADFGAAPAAGDPAEFARLPATFATTAQTFTRLSTGGQVVIPIGSTVQTQDGSLKYEVIVDATNGAYNASLGGYVLADTVATVVCPVQCTTLGSAGNAVSGSINTIASAIPGVSITSNASAATNGTDAELTADMNVRFRRYMNALRRATSAALEVAVTSLQRNVTAKVVECTHTDGTTEKGFTTIIVDDGTGSPSSDLLTAASAAVDESKAASNPFAVIGPVVVEIDVAAALVTVPNTDHAAAIAAAVNALQAYLNTLPISATVYWSRIWQVIQDASPDILEVTGLTVNAGTADITMSFKQVAKAHTLAIS